MRYYDGRSATSFFGEGGGVNALPMSTCPSNINLNLNEKKTFKKKKKTEKGKGFLELV